MKLWTRVLLLSLFLISLMTLGIKFYFMNQANEYLELSIKDQMKRDMRAFENVILIVATVAGNNENVVRKALFSISENPQIPIELRRSDLIIKQFGAKPGHEAQNKTEERVFLEGKAMFRENEKFFEYVYPLKANAICQNCHIQANGQKVVPGYVLGLAIKKIPKSVLKDSTLSYQIMDLFWENLFMVIVVFVFLIVSVYYWYVHPINKIVSRVQPVIAKLDDDTQIPENEIQFINKGLDALIKDSKRNE